MNKLILVLFAVIFLVASNTHAELKINMRSSVPSPKNTSFFTNPYQVLMAYYDAIGGLDALKKEKNSYSRGTIKFADMSGEFQSWSQEMRYREEAHYPAFSTIEGDDGEQMWTVDLNRKKLVLTDEKTKKRRRLRELLEQFENANPTSKYFKLKLRGIETVMDEPCYVIETRNTINDDISYDYFSISSYLLLKKMIKQPFLEIVTYYSDFQKIDKITYSFHRKTNINPIGKEITIQIDEMQINKAIAPETFFIPETDVKDYQFESDFSAQSIPFLLVENNIYLPVTIQGKQHYWILDSGADMSVIDAGYADKIGLIPVGKFLGHATDNLAEFNFVKLEKYQIQGVELFNQTILSYQGLADNFFEPDAIGILGYDFLSRFITKVDYAKQTVSFFQPEHFTYNGSGKRIDAPLQNKLFMVPMRINGDYEGHYGLDLGSFNVSMNYPFAKKHKFIDKKGVLRLSSDIAGVFYEQQIKSKTMEIAGYAVEGELFSFPIQKGNGTNSDAEVDGLIGNSLLRHFTLFLDYKHQQLIVEKGDNYNTGFPVDKSGMIIGHSVNNLPEIFYVAENTPAQQAGIQSGDVIIAIDDLSGNTLPGISKIIAMLRAESGTQYKLTLLRNKQKIIVDLQLKNLYQ